jgi:hypothetical protein
MVDSFMLPLMNDCRFYVPRFKVRNFLKNFQPFLIGLFIFTAAASAKTPAEYVDPLIGSDKSRWAS